jgi:ATP-binding cassette subfamily C protein LapB
MVIGVIGGPLVLIPLLSYPLALLVSWLIQRPLMSRVQKPINWPMSVRRCW